MTDRIHLVVATPCFGGQVSSIYAGSIFHLQRAVRSRSNIELSVLMRDGDALITRARANLVTLFLDNPSATHLLFVDADIGFEPDQAFRMIESGADVVAGVYPIKRVNWDKAKRMLESNRPKLPSRGTVPIAGTINGFPFRTSVMPDGKGSHSMMVNKAMRAGGKVGPGDEVAVVFTVRSYLGLNFTTDLPSLSVVLNRIKDSFLPPGRGTSKPW